MTRDCDHYWLFRRGGTCRHCGGVFQAGAPTPRPGDVPLRLQEQLFQNIGMGPHLPLLAVPPVYTGYWVESDWARWMGLSVDDYRLVCRIGARHSKEG